MDPRINRFLKQHHVLTLATNSDEGPWTAHCFYAYMPEHQALVFTSDPETRHGRSMLQNPNVSGGIALETKVIGLIRGIQLTGQVLPCFTPDSTVTEPPSENCHPDERPAPAKAWGRDPVPYHGSSSRDPVPYRESLNRDPVPYRKTSHGPARTAYLLRFPFALAAKLDLWILYIDYIKMTDNRLGFGKKLEWRREV